MRLQRTKQCAKCPWKVSTNPHDIPDGYCEMKHAGLKNTIAEEGKLNLSEPMVAMACHHSNGHDEMYCIGWLHNQLGPGNNIALRLKMLNCENIGQIEVVGEQHSKFEQTLPKSESKCPKCQGSGKYNKYGDCYSCRGTGEMAFVKDGLITFLGKEYKAGDEVPFLNTRGNIDMGKITGFWNSDSKSYEEKSRLDGWMNINSIWYNLTVIRTGKSERYPLWKSALQAFGNAEKVKPTKSK